MAALGVRLATGVALVLAKDKLRTTTSLQRNHESEKIDEQAKNDHLPVSVAVRTVSSLEQLEQSSP